MKRAFVTGATGLVGSHLACLLKSRGYNVLLLHRGKSKKLFDSVVARFQLTENDFTWILGDILDTDSFSDAVNEVDVVFHCAAIVSFNKKDESRIMETNFIGTRNVCNVCLKHNTVLIHASSVAAIGRAGKNNSISEDAEWVESDYNSIYAASKHLAEVEVWRAKTEGLDVAIVNPGIILGAGDGESGSNSIFKYVSSRSRFYPVGTNGFVDLRDVCVAMILLYENQMYGERYLLVSENWEYQKLLTSISTLLKVKAPDVALKGTLLSVAIKISRFCEFWGIPFPFPSQALVSTSSKSIYEPVNPSKISGFVFTPVQESLEYCIKSLQG